MSTAVPPPSSAIASPAQPTASAPPRPTGFSGPSGATGSSLSASAGVATARHPASPRSTRSTAGASPASLTGQVSAGPAPAHPHPTTAGTTSSHLSTTGQLTRIGQCLGERIGGHKYGLWFDRQTTRLRVEGGSLLVELATPYVADWIGRHFAEDLAAVARDTLGTQATVSLRVAPDLFTRAEGDPGEVQSQIADSGRDGTHEPLRDHAARSQRRGEGAFEPDRVTLLPPPLRRPTAEGRRIALRKLDEFVAGPSNQLAFDAARRVAEGAPGATHLLFVHGDCGVGKTHLLQGICDRRRALSPRSHVRYTTAEQFTNEYLAALREGSLESFRKSLRRLDLLAIDDIHFLSNKTATQSEFLHTMDAIDLSGARIVLASDEHPRQIKKFSQALVSRFLSGMVVRVDRPDRQTRISLLRRLARARGMALQPAAEEIVANRCVGSVREIEGALARLAAFATLLPSPRAAQHDPRDNQSPQGQRGASAPDAADDSDLGAAEPTVAPTGRMGGVVEIGALIAERAFEEESVSRPAGPIRITEIVDRVSSRLGVEREDVLGSIRHRRVVLARSIVVFLARELTTQSFPEIARALGRDTHSTAHTACKRVEQMLADGERVETGDPSLAGDDGLTPLKELLAQLRHDIVRFAPRAL